MNLESTLHVKLFFEQITLTSFAVSLFFTYVFSIFKTYTYFPYSLKNTTLKSNFQYVSQQLIKLKYLKYHY